MGTQQLGRRSCSGCERVFSTVTAEMEAEPILDDSLDSVESQGMGEVEGTGGGDVYNPMIPMTMIYDNSTSPMSVTTSGCGIRGNDDNSDNDDNEPMTTIPITQMTDVGGGGSRRKKESSAEFITEREMC